jgi:hypothetical protein
LKQGLSFVKHTEPGETCRFSQQPLNIHTCSYGAKGEFVTRFFQLALKNFSEAAFKQQTVDPKDQTFVTLAP